MNTTTHEPSHPNPTPGRPGSSAVARFVRRRPLTAFLMWFFTVGQALVFTPIVVRGCGVELPAQVFVVASTLIGLLLPAVVITRVVDGPAGARALWRRAVDVWVGARWYALALAGMPALATGLAFAFFGAPTAALATGALVSALVAGLLVQTLVSLVPNNWAEEVAWMGFVQARLQSRTTPMRAAALTAPLFALQHVALVVGSPLPMAVAVALHRRRPGQDPAGQRDGLRPPDAPPVPHPRRRPLPRPRPRRRDRAQPGVKDTVLIPTGQTVDILLDVTNPGLWMAHCHIAEHMHSCPGSTPGARRCSASSPTTLPTWSMPPRGTTRTCLYRAVRPMCRLFQTAPGTDVRRSSTGRRPPCPATRRSSRSRSTPE
jgi:hypothetical protein